MYENKHTHSLGMAIIIPMLVYLLSTGAAFAATPAPSLTEIQVSFKLDPRITKGMYMGDRWVSPPTFTSLGDEEKCVVEARATGLDAGKREIAINPSWSPGLASMVRVSPDRGNRVEITVLEEGQCDLTVTAGPVSRKFTIKAVRRQGVLQVDISR